MVILRNFNILLLIAFLSVVRLQTEMEKADIIPEINDQNLSEVINQLREEKDPRQREFLRLIVNPEQADLNHDRKISPNELRKIVEKMLLPKGKEAAMKLNEELIANTKAGIELFTTNIYYNLNYKQFQELMTRIRTEHFVNVNRANAFSVANEFSVELPDDL